MANAYDPTEHEHKPGGEYNSYVDEALEAYSKARFDLAKKTNPDYKVYATYAEALEAERKQYGLPEGASAWDINKAVNCDPKVNLFAEANKAWYAEYLKTDLKQQSLLSNAINNAKVSITGTSIQDLLERYGLSRVYKGE
jgi:hypothetical protein